MLDLKLDVTKDTASLALVRLAQYLAGAALRRNVGAAVTVFTQAHLRSLVGNKMGWPSQDFYKKAALGTRYENTSDGVRVLIDNEDAPGAMKHQYNGGVNGRTVINMKDKLLAIPARAEFYGKSPGQFDNLKFVMFAGGAKALVIGQGGAQLVNFSTGKGSSKGTGARSAMMVAYWLKPSVEQDAKPEVLPTREQYMEVIRMAIGDGVNQLTKNQNN